MSERAVFPLLTGWNSPSYVLEAVKRLLALGIPEENLRFLPVIGHFALPEICAQEPAGPSYDARTRKVTVLEVNPSEVRPRITVSVRTETLMRFWRDANGSEQHDERVMGRLAHFMPPLMAGIPGAEPERVDTPENPLDRLTRHVAAAYPELLATLQPIVQQAFLLVADEMIVLMSLGEKDTLPRSQRAAQAIRHVADHPLRAECRASFDRMAEKAFFKNIGDAGDEDPAKPRNQFLWWGNSVFGPAAEAGSLGQEVAALSEPERVRQQALWRAFRTAVLFETVGERIAIVRELMEILTTEAFLAVAALDAMNGIGWIHGRLSDICVPSESVVPDGLLLSVTGGHHRGGILLALLQSWAVSQDGVLGVRSSQDGGRTLDGNAPPRRECLDLSVMDETDQLELFSLVALRRESGDVRAVLELAARRLIHPDIQVHWQRFNLTPGPLGTLLAQPGQTAALGGQVLLQFPGLTISVPLTEDADTNAIRAKSVLSILLRLFVPVTCRADVVWRESVASLNGSSYLHHDFQRGARLADISASIT